MANGCERHMIATYANANLYHYRNLSAQVTSLPLFIIYALVNTPEILDIHPERSFIRYLLKQGIDIYLLEWKRPTLQDKNLSLADYILGDMQQAINQVRQYVANNPIHLMGVCQGGYFSVCYAALFPENVATLIPVVTPIDFAMPKNRLFQLIQSIDVDKLVDKLGNIPGNHIYWILQQIAPFRAMYKKWKAQSKGDKLGDKLLNTQSINTRKLNETLFAAIEAWDQDCLPQAGRAFAEFAKMGIQQNALIKGNLALEGKKIDLAKLTPPIFNIYADNDHIWPCGTTSALRYYHNSKHYQEHVFNGGHIGIFASEHGVETVPPLIKAWVDGNMED